MRRVDAVFPACKQAARPRGEQDVVVKEEEEEVVEAEAEEERTAAKRMLYAPSSRVPHRVENATPISIAQPSSPVHSVESGL